MSEITAADGTLQSLTIQNLQPSFLSIADLVRIDLKTGALTFGEHYTPDAAAKAFWDAMGQHFRHSIRGQALIEKVRMIIALHDEFVETVPTNEDDAFERWDAAVSQLRAALEKVTAS